MKEIQFESRLRHELVEALGRTTRQKGRVRPRLAALATVSALILVGFGTYLVLLHSDEGGRPQEAEAIAPAPNSGPALMFPGYPEEWRVAPEDAAQVAKFDVIVPREEGVSPDSASGAFVQPDGMRVIYVYPSFTDSEQGLVRRDEVEIEEVRWGTDFDPRTHWADQVQELEGDAVITEIRGTAVFAIKPNSKHDSESANVAFVEFVSGGIDVTISGGSDLERLMRIADSMIP